MSPIRLARRIWTWAAAALLSGIKPQAGFVLRRMIDMPAPEKIKRHQIVVVGPADRPKWITFKCPCECGETLLLSTSKTRRPRWSLAVDSRGRPSVFPSVRRTDGCFAHFWVRNGRIEWCADTGIHTD